ncbi:hypothetical protein Maes01_01225 [Microbulbifer aestuariivivens]|uniref:DUF1440 domain-containing protein n=1 Tax=Microbulbifer aestuariivivens TaxID=1908308 RepID=A0ABP9WPY3_9GAMM
MSSSSIHIKQGLIAGFWATVVLSMIMVMKAMMGLMPNMNPIADIVHVFDMFTGMQAGMMVGWLGHFFIGTVAWGILYSLLVNKLPGGGLMKGLIFGAIAWMAMMVIFMPLAGQGFFGMKEGIMAMMATLMLHMVYGAVLGLVYAKLTAHR